MRVSEVLRSLLGGCAVYTLAMACSSSGSDGSGPTGPDTGGVTGMNGNAGETGTGAMAMAATGGSTGETCECPQPEAPVEITVNCEANYMSQLWAELTITGVTASDIARISYVSFADDGDALVGTPGEYTHATSSVIAFKPNTVAVQCWGNKATFIVPADLAESIP